ncbi:MAG: alpha/beta hydrolase [bacterium]
MESSSQSAEKKSFIAKIKISFSSLKDKCLDILSNMRRGAAIGILIAFFAFMFIVIAQMQTGLGLIPDIIIFMVVGGVLYFLTFLFTKLVLKIFKSIPEIFLSIVLSVLVIIMNVPVQQFGRPLIVLGLIAGGLIGFALKRGILKPLSIILSVLVVTAVIFVSISLISEGFDNTIPVKESYWKSNFKQIEATDPSVPGEYEVKTFFYGSGTDKHREEFGAKVNLKTKSVDATPFFDETNGFGNYLRELFWGFNGKNYPINGSVWYPEGDGPFPLVLIVHGNHQMEDFSDPGYAYLGELLASRGYIFVSVDENFLNGNWVTDYGQNENFTRGWILLEHLKNWRTWNQTEENPFFKKVDMDNIALMGHSRGGQAVAIAAAINKLPCYHLDAKVKFDFNFNIKSIIQIAPIDIYNPKNGQPLELQNINYLVVQGGYDHDMSCFMGNAQYNRLKFSGSEFYFKSALYIYRANHGQFNTSWGRYDYGIPLAWLLNVKPVMRAEYQRKIAKIFFSAFLDATLKSKTGYIEIFKDYRNAKSWLPKDYYINQYEDSDMDYFTDYEDDLDLHSTPDTNITITGNNLKVWSENSLVFRNWGSSQSNRGVYLGWNSKDSLYKKKTISYQLNFTNAFYDTPGNRSVKNLFFFVCNNRNDIDSVDFTIELTDQKNEIIKTSLLEIFELTPQLKTELTKWNFIYDIASDKPVERVLQYVSIPTTHLESKNKVFDPGILKSIKFIFDKSPEGEIILDKIGYGEL